MLAADQWREPLTVQGLEPAFGTALTLDLNSPPISRRVAWLMMTLPGAVSACNRAARFGVSPTTVCS